jgi:pyruvate dehydrogenase E1 component alpha subunit
MPDPAPLGIFENVYTRPSAILDEERKQYAAYLAGFADGETETALEAAR